MDKATLISIIYALGSFSGQIAFWAKRWGDGEECVLANRRRTVASIVGNFTSTATTLAAGVPAALIDLPLAAVFFSGFTLGVAADSLLNKGVRKPWTDEDRRDAKRNT